MALIALALTACGRSAVESGEPKQVGAIPTQSLLAGSAATAINLDDYFADAQGDPLRYSAQTSDAAVVRASVTGSTLYLTPQSQVGFATVTVTARDASSVVTASFQVQTRESQSPFLGEAIPDFTVRAGNTRSLDLSHYFRDLQTRAADLRYDASVAGDAVTVTVSGVILNYTSGQSVGTSTVTVRATDPDGNSESTSFQIAVVTINHEPQIESTAAFGGRDVTASFPLGTLAIPSNGQSRLIDLEQVFSDDQTADSSLSFVVRLADETVARAVIADQRLRITAVGNGTTTGTLTVSDDEPSRAKAQKAFAFKVIVSQPPIANPLPDRGLNARETAEIELADYFADPNNRALTYTVRSDNDQRASGSIASGDSVLLVTAGLKDASTLLTVTAQNSDGLEVESQFAVFVTNEPPALIASIPDQGLASDGESDVPLAIYITDREDARANDLSDMDFMALSSNTTVVDSAVTTQNGTTVLRLTGRGQGQATITLAVTDSGEKKVQTTVNVTVGGNVPPVAGTLADFELAPNASAAPIDLNQLFTDPDPQDAGNLVFTVGQDNQAVSAVVTQASLALTAGGTTATGTQFTVTARDSTGGQDTLTFRVDVTTTAPRATCVFADPITVSGGARPAFVNIENGLASAPGESCVSDGDRTDQALDLNFAFADLPAPGTLKFSATSSDDNAVSPTVDGNDVLRVLARTDAGSARITVIAEDLDGNTVTRSFNVTNTAVSVPPAVSAIPPIRRDVSLEAQAVTINVGDFVTDADAQDNDDDRMNPKDCTVTGAGGNAYSYRVSHVSNPAVALATMGAGMDCDLLTVTLQPQIGTTTVSVEIKDDDLDVASATVDVEVVKPKTNLFVLNGTSGVISRLNADNSAAPNTLNLGYVIDVPAGAVADSPTAPSTLGLAKGFVIDEAGTLYQAGSFGKHDPGCDNAANPPEPELTITTQVRALHNALNRVPAPPATRDPSVRGPGGDWDTAFDRSVGISAAATSPCRATPLSIPPRPTPTRTDENVAYDSHRGVVIIAAAETAAMSSAGAGSVWESIRFMASQSGAAGRPRAGLTMADLLGSAHASVNAAAPIDVAFAPPRNANDKGTLFVTVGLYSGNALSDSLLVRCTNPYKLGGGPAGCVIIEPTPACQGPNGGTLCHFTGVDYLGTTDTLVVTDAGPAGSDPDGSVYVFHDIALASGSVVPDMTIRGAASCLVNPTDVAVEMTARGGDILVADPASDPASNGTCGGGTAPAGSVMRFNDAASIGAASVSTPSSAIELTAATRIHLRNIPTATAPDASDADRADSGLSKAASTVLAAGTSGALYELQATFGTNPALAQKATPSKYLFAAPTSGVFGLSVDQAGNVTASVREGLAQFQPGGLIIANTNVAAIGATGSMERKIETPQATGSATDLVAPAGFDLAEMQGVAIVADQRDANATTSGAILVLPFGAELGDVKPDFTTVLANVRPNAVDYDAANDRLFVAANNGTLVIFDDFLKNRYTTLTQPVAARVVIPANRQGSKVSTNLTGVVALDDGTVFLSDDPSSAVADGQILVLQVDGTSDGLVTTNVVIAQVLRSGVVTPLDNPAALAFDAQHDLLYIAENNATSLGNVYQVPILRSAAGVVSGYQDATSAVVLGGGEAIRGLVAVPDYVADR